VNGVILKYLRISDEDIDLDGKIKHESDSIVNQRALLDDYIAKMPEFDGCEIIEVFDDGRTGTNFSRPGAQKVIEMAQSGKFQCIIVKDLSRWGRNYIEVGDFLEQKFPAWGVRFISVGDNYDSAKLNHSTSGIDIAFRNLIYELYSQDLSVKCRSGKNAVAKSGKILSTYPTFGYDKDKNDRHKFVVDPIDAPIVKRIFDMAEQGHRVFEIVKVLNAENVSTKQMSKHRKGYKTNWGRGDCWDSSAVIDTLRNECYTGIWIHGKKRTVQIGTTCTKTMPRSDWIIIPDAIPALVTKEQFQIVQEKLNAVYRGNTKKGVSKTPRSIFSSLVKCPKCGRNMDFNTRSAEQHGVFFCKTKGRSDKFGCTSEKIGEYDLADAVLTILRQQIALVDLHQSVMKTKAVDKVSPKVIFVEIQSLQKLIEQIKSTKITLWESYHGGSITKDKFQAESERLTNQVVAYESKINELTAQMEEANNQSNGECGLVKRMVELTGIQTLTRELVLEFVSEIKVFSSERIEIVWKYGDIFEKMMSNIENN